MAGLRTAAILHWFLGLGFGIPGVFGIRNLAAGRGILYFMGFPTYGKGPFERVGIQTTVPLLSAFVFVCFPRVRRRVAVVEWCQVRRHPLLRPLGSGGGILVGLCVADSTDTRRGGDGPHRGELGIPCLTLSGRADNPTFRCHPRDWLSGRTLPGRRPP